VVTVKDVARHAGVSIGTVDRVLHERGRVAEETRSRVLAALEELGYQPNVHARNLSRKKTYLIDLMTPAQDADGGYWRLPLNGIHRALERLPVQNLVIRHRVFDRHDERTFREQVEATSLGIPADSQFQRAAGNTRAHVQEATAPADRAGHQAGGSSLEYERRVPDGLLVAPVVSREAQDQLTEIITRHQIPAVSFDSRLHGSGVPFVGQDPFQGGMVAGRLTHMVRRPECRSVASITFGDSDEHLLQRAAGFRNYWDGTSDARLAELILADQGDSAYVGDLSRRLPALLPDFGAVFVTNAASALVLEALDRIGFSGHPPLVGYDLLPQNAELLRSGRIDVVISQKPEQQGYEAASMLAHHVVFGASMQSEMLMPIEIVLSENLDSFAGT